MDWLVDRREAGAMDRALDGLGQYLRRHAVLDAAVEPALDAVRALVEDAAGSAEGLLQLHLDWRAQRPRASVVELTGVSTADLGRVGTGSSLSPGTVDSLTGADGRQLGETTLEIERPAQEAFTGGPPAMVPIHADPHRQGVASVPVALTAAAKAHPSSNAAQLAALAGAALADNVVGDSPPRTGAEVAAMVAQAHQALGSDARVLAADDAAVEVVISRCPFAPGVSDSDALCHVSTALAGQLGARVNGEATVVLPESIAAGDPACHLTVRLDAATEDLNGELHRWPATTGAPSRRAPHLELSVNLPSETTSVPVVRRLAAQALRSFGVADRDVDDVQLAIAEACANVIEHAIDSDTYEVQVELAADQCAITVIDQGSGFDATAVPENPDPRSEGGRGLALMRALTDKVAFRNEPQAGTVVHMTKRLEHDETHPLWNRPQTRR
ncbi:MAG TPA: ATP-binding protein [Marmoricola sp.]